MEQVKETDIYALKEMFDENFGQGYMSEEKMKYYINNDRELFYASRCEDGTLCGAVLFGEESAETLSSQTNIPMDNLLKMAAGKKLLKCRTLCVASDCQKKSVGENLFSGAIEEIKQKGVYGLITSLLWEYGGKVPARKIHEDNGFRFLYRLKEPWYSLEDYYCVYCKGRCRCDGLQYVLELTGK